ncbi:cell division protein FtsL [Paracoccus salsus]|uniref:cell division protein FtsL n=1 Tax=Paracoccus salsus TaxID=2911061 RepID=UPI001F2B3B78|nr:cell division protein FtsL [Paracoccus salsus]MCF3972826.1 cell division protein FtsL [Paracoccus salsus]
MRSLTYLLVTLLVMGLAFWAYRENYRTQAEISEMGQVQREIAGLRDDLGVLRAEWAYLNRPDRLRELVDLNFERLQLVPVESGQYIDLGHVDYPKPPAPPDADPVERADSEEQQP